jgi:hypothetical protein
MRRRVGPKHVAPIGCGLWLVGRRQGGRAELLVISQAFNARISIGSSEYYSTTAAPYDSDVAMLSTYAGPANLHDDLVIALRTLAGQLSVTAHTCESHTLLQVEGFGSPSTLQASAVYLVAAIAQCIGADLLIRTALFNEATLARDLTTDVRSVVGRADAEDEFKKMTRDPWIWEGISHLVIHLAVGNSSFHPTGRVLAKTQLKYDVKDHGLDLVAIYERDSLGITAGESKAYLDNPSRAVSDAAKRLREIDESLRDVEMRACVSQLRPSLKDEHQAKLGGAFWREERSYYPFVCCDESSALEWKQPRNSLESLAIAVSRKLLVPFALKQARQAFDEVARLMRGYADGSLRI